MDRQRVLIIFGVAWLSALGLSYFVYAKTKMPVEEKKVAIFAAAKDLQVGTRLKKTDVHQIRVSAAHVPKGALTQEKQILDRVLLFPVTENEPITLAKMSTTTAVEGIPSTIEPGYRAVSVQVTDVSGVAGLIQPGARVDVLFTKPGSMAEAITSTILQNVKVLSMGRNVTPVTSATADTANAAAAVSKAAPNKTPVVTLVVTPEQAQKLELAKNEGKISLTLRNPLDQAVTDGDSPMTTEVLDPMVSARLARARRGRTTNFAGKMNLEDPAVWQELTGEKKLVDKEKERQKVEEEARKKAEADKPKFIVDVYRGDKHVQEQFK